MERLYVLDTTLRDGEQVPGAKLTGPEKLEIAHQLVRLGVDVIEAGFPSSSPGDFRAVQNIAREIRGASVTALARAVRSDIDAVWEAIREAENPQIHMVLGVSDIHIQGKFARSREEILQMGVDAVRYARRYTSSIQYSTEDAGRADLAYLARTVEAVIDAGASVVNIPDTTGYCGPDEFAGIIRYLFEHVPNIHRALVSVHCHNDLGQATANTLAAVRAGARRIEVTINGLGERAGNCALEEAVMAIKVRPDRYGVQTGIVTSELYRTSQLVSSLTGVWVQRNKAIVGANAFAHSSGIHQDGVLKQRLTYEIIDPRDVGVPESSIVLTARSGRHALRARLEDLGYTIEGEAFEEIHRRFLELADRKKEVFDGDLVQLVRSQEHDAGQERGYALAWAEVHCVPGSRPRSRVCIVRPDGTEAVEEAEGDGPVDAAYRAVGRIIPLECKLLEFGLRSVTEGIDAQAQVHARIQVGERIYTGSAAETDIVLSGIRAYVDAMNRALADQAPIPAGERA